jgi:hypothetical protein
MEFIFIFLSFLMTLLYFEGLLHRERHLALRLLHTRARAHTHTHTNIHTHTLRGFCSLNGVLPCASSMDTNTQTPSFSHTHTHTYLERLLPLKRRLTLRQLYCRYA